MYFIVATLIDFLFVNCSCCFSCCCCSWWWWCWWCYWWCERFNIHFWAFEKSTKSHWTFFSFDEYAHIYTIYTRTLEFSLFMQMKVICVAFNVKFSALVFFRSICIQFKQWLRLLFFKIVFGKFLLFRCCFCFCCCCVAVAVAVVDTISNV